MWQMASLVGYARVSTESQAERQTIEQQVESLTRYAHEHGWDLDRGDIYRDEGFSGARLDRPGLDRLRDAVSSGEVDTILVASPDRLARRYAYQVWLLEEFERAGCRVVFLEHPLSDDPQDALLVQIRGAVAEYERTVIADRMRRGRLSALQAGRMLPFSIPPFGYRADPLRPRDPEALRVDEGEAMVVRRIFEGYVEEGLSLYGMAKALTEEGVPTSAGKAIWSSSTIHKILTNPTYSGTCYGNREQAVAAKRRYPLLGREARGEGGVTNRLRPRQEWIALEVPAIVSAELFRQAQERMSQKQDRALRNTRGEYLLRRLVSCSSCGLACIVRNNGRKASYVCGGKGPLIMRRRPERCSSPQIPTEQLDELVWEDLRRVLNEPAVLEEALRQARQGWQDGTERGARRKELHRAELELRRRIERLMEGYLAGVVGLDELRERKGKLEEKQANLRRQEQQLAAEEVSEDRLRAIAMNAEEFRATITRGLDKMSFAQKRTLVELLIDRVILDPPGVEIRYVIPISGAAQRNGVLRPRHFRGGGGREAGVTRVGARSPRPGRGRGR
jgi:site-specific DNA recombinase